MTTDARRSSIDFHNQAVAVVGRDPQLAYRLLCSAVTVDPTMAQGWFLLGNSLADLKLLPASIAAFRRCVDCPLGDEPGDLTQALYGKAMVNLSHRLLNNGEINEAMRRAREGFHLLDPDDRPNLAFAQINLSLILSQQGDTDEALTQAMIAFDLSKEPIIETGLAFAYLFAGDFANGLRHFEARFPYKLPQMLDFPWPRWNGENL